MRDKKNANSVMLRLSSTQPQCRIVLKTSTQTAILTFYTQRARFVLKVEFLTPQFARGCLPRKLARFLFIISLYLYSVRVKYGSSSLRSQTMSTGSILFKRYGLYILLSDIGYTNRFHWAFFMSTDENHGTIFHLTNGQDINWRDTWIYETKTINQVPAFDNLLLALQVAEIPPELHQALAKRLAKVPIHGNSTCRVWLKEALVILDEEGYIKLIRTVQEIEQEAAEQAERNRREHTRTIEKSKFSSL
jgi:hypothetical protein